MGLYIDQIDPKQFENERRFVMAVLYPEKEHLCLADNRRGYQCRQRPAAGEAFCRSHKD